MAATKSSHGFLGFGFGGLDQEALGHQQREVDGGGVLVVVEQALGDVERGDVVVLGLFGEGEDEFVAGAALGSRPGSRGIGVVSTPPQTRDCQLLSLTPLNPRYVARTLAWA